MTVKITTLIENNPGEHFALKAEHGLAFFIEKDNHRILFDTGQSAAFLENARQLRIDLRDLEYVVLSHGHYDHSGGLRDLLKVARHFELLMGPGFFNEKYGLRNDAYDYLGNNFDEQFLIEQGVAYRFVDQSLTELVPGVYVMTGFSRVHPDEVINPRFKILKNGVMQPDSFADEVLLAVDSEKGLIVLLGCSHPGMKNMLDAVVHAIQRPLYGILGGTHLVEASDESLELSLDYLRKKQIQAIGVSHCTGQTAMDRLASSDMRYFHNHTGSSLFVA